MNRVILSGRLARDPEVRYTQSGKAVAGFAIAVDRNVRRSNENQQQPTADFFNVTAWEKLADFCGKYLSKGRKILLEGRLQSRSYEAQDGSKRNVVEIVADNIEFMDSKRQNGDEGSYGNTNNYSGGGYSNNTYSKPSASSSNGDDMIDNGSSKTPDDFDIPF